LIRIQVMEVNRMKITARVSIALLSIIASLTTGMQEVHAAGSDAEPAVAAEQHSAAFPVIVIFRDDSPFQEFRGSFHADDRARDNPAAWDYLDHGVAGAVQNLEAIQGFRADHVYSAALRGFSARLTAWQIDALENDPLVAYVEADGTMAISVQLIPWGITRIDADLSTTLAGNGSGAIANVNAYIIDTGIDTNHTDLNVVRHVNFAGGPNKDCNGHGTHVSGTVAARDDTADVVGVAPGAPLTGVKVLGCSGSGKTSGVIKGIDWVTANAVKPAIANMSLGGGASKSLDDAVIKSADSHVFYSIAAGNSGANACNYSPARAGTHNGVMTTAATDSSDKEASWSNYGNCVDIWAPGVSILSTKKGGGTTTMSGTSMAAPHVGGTGALYLSSHTGATPATVEAAIKTDADRTGKTSKDGRSIILDYAGEY
jgi:aqualysin 1